jgi:hypothetical protein
LDPFREEVANGEPLDDVPELLREVVGHLGAKPNTNARIILARYQHRPTARALAQRTGPQLPLPSCAERRGQLISETLAGVGNPFRTYVQL